MNLAVIVMLGWFNIRGLIMNSIGDSAKNYRSL